MAFATHADVSTRLRRTLTTEEQAAATEVIATVTGLIADEVDRDSDWSDALDPVPTTLKELCVAKAVTAITNPAGVASETLGAHSVTFPRSADGGVFLTDAEKRAVEVAVYGRSGGSSQPRGVIDRIVDMREAREVDEGFANAE